MAVKIYRIRPACIRVSYLCCTGQISLPHGAGSPTKHVRCSAENDNVCVLVVIYGLTTIKCDIVLFPEKYMPRFCWSLVFISLFTSGFSTYAQDTRHVTEPVVPPPCVVLKAQLQANAGKLSERDEQQQDTKRIQQAIASCQPGKAVELRADGAKNI